MFAPALLTQRYERHADQGERGETLVGGDQSEIVGKRDRGDPQVVRGLSAARGTQLAVARGDDGLYSNDRRLGQYCREALQTLGPHARVAGEKYSGLQFPDADDAHDPRLLKLWRA